jgi:nardilysin
MHAVNHKHFPVFSSLLHVVFLIHRLILHTSRYMFDISKLEAEELRTVQKDDVIAWYNTYIRSTSPKRRRLAIHVYGCNSDIAEATKVQKQSWTVIDDVQALKASSQFYSSLC